MIARLVVKSRLFTRFHPSHPKREFFGKALGTAFHKIGNALSSHNKKGKEKEEKVDQMSEQMDANLKEMVDKIAGKGTIASFFLRNGLKVVGKQLQKMVAESGEEMNWIVSTSNNILMQQRALVGDHAMVGTIVSFHSFKNRVDRGKSGVVDELKTSIAAVVTSDDPRVNQGRINIIASMGLPDGGGDNDHVHAHAEGLRIDSMVIETACGRIIEVPVGNSQRVAAASKPIIIDVQSRD
jgi:hypothetical protein